MKKLSTIAIAFLCLSVAALARTKPAAPAQASAPASAPTEPEKKSLSSEQAAALAEAESLEAQFRLKLGEMEQMLSALIQAKKADVWTSACKAAGWTKQQGECQVDQATRTISHNVPKTDQSAK